jgi:hypothetical protein
MKNPPVVAQRILKSLTDRSELGQWETLIGGLLHRLELDTGARADAERAYKDLGASIARKLNIPEHDVIVSPQGSMATQTTIRPRGNTNFDLDIFVELLGWGYDRLSSEQMFSMFGKALEGNESVTGVPEPKRRCWRLPYTGKSYYFDVTPAVKGQSYAGGEMRVRDPDTEWAPTNPREFADWFCEIAKHRFQFSEYFYRSLAMDSATVNPLPSEKIGIDDVLRRAVQLMKLHRDNMYWEASPRDKETMPISIIIGTLAAQAYDDLRLRGAVFSSPLDAALTLVEKMPDYIEQSDGVYQVLNPKLPGENFADKWNFDGKARANQFGRWHNTLLDDLERLTHQSVDHADEAAIRKVFGTAGVDAWNASRPKAPTQLGGLISSGLANANPKAPINPGSSSTLG